MRVKINFYINESRKLRTPINSAITALIYRAIAEVDREYSNKMHEKGNESLGYKKLIYHTYALSQGTTLLNKDINKGKTSLIFSSAVDDVTIKFVQGLIKIGSIQIFGKSYEIESIEHIKEPKISGMFNILSPVYAEGSGRKWLDKKEMEIATADLLTEKYFALHNELPKKDTRIKLLNAKHKYMYYKKDIYRGFLGNVIIEGDKEVQRLAYNGGLGGKCGSGMGLLKVI